LYTEKGELKTPFCNKKCQKIEGTTESSVNLALVGIPEWCPLESVKEKELINFKEELFHILQILQIKKENFNLDAIPEASHYLNTAIQRGI